MAELKRDHFVTLEQMLHGRETGLSKQTRKSRDEADLNYFGKKQRFKVLSPVYTIVLTNEPYAITNFGLISITGLTCCIMVTWEASLLGIGPQLLNGGPTGLFAGFIMAWAGAFFQMLVMAEMASMIPLSGGQYNWVAILAPKSASNFLSYMVGWLTNIAWQSGSASVTYIAASTIQNLAALNFPNSYIAKNWHTTLIFYAIVLVALGINLFAAWSLPKLEALSLGLHIVGFFVVLITLVYLSPHNQADDVFDYFINGGGWSSNALSFFVGLVSSMMAFIGVDGAAHLAEEVVCATSVVPRAMIITNIVNGLTGIGMIVALLFCLQNAVVAIDSESLPVISVFAKATGSTAGATALAIIPLVILIVGSMGILAASSRTVWAFAREGGMPGSKYLSKVSKHKALPVWSIGLCVVVQLVLGLINIGSTIAFNAFIGLTVEGFFSVFLISASVMLHKRLTTPPDQIRWGAFRLGALGVPITILALAYTVLGFFFSFWPPIPNPSIEEWNWAMIVYLGTTILALIWWFIHARHRYHGPMIDGD